MARSREELLRMNEMNDEFAECVKRRPVKLRQDDPVTHRAQRASHLQRLRHLMPIPGPISEVREKDHFIAARDGYKIPVRIYSPSQQQPDDSPVIILIHEGGFSMGDLSDEEMTSRLLVRELGAVCINVEYRLSPEHSFPMGVLDAWDTVRWAAENSIFLRADPERGFIVGGSSAGGNISAVLSHLSKSECLTPPLTGQWLSVPYLIPPTLVPEKYQSEYISMYGNKNDPVLGEFTPERLRELENTLQITDPDNPLYTPFASSLYPPKSSKRHENPLPRAYFQVAGLDPLRDHALIYDRVLREEYGIETKVDIYPGFSHMFWTNWPEMKESSKFWEDTVNGFKWMLRN